MFFCPPSMFFKAPITSFFSPLLSNEFFYSLFHCFYYPQSLSYCSHSEVVKILSPFIFNLTHLCTPFFICFLLCNLYHLFSKLYLPILLTTMKHTFFLSTNLLIFSPHNFFLFPSLILFELQTSSTISKNFFLNLLQSSSIHLSISPPPNSASAQKLNSEIL